MAGEAGYSTLPPGLDTTDTTRDRRIPISENEGSRLPAEDHCIHRVPFVQCQIDPDAYTPRVILIGPLQYAKAQEASRMQQLVCTSPEMEKVKFRYKHYLTMDARKYYYLRSFSERAGREVPNILMSYIEDNLEKIQACYEEETSWIPRQEFTNLILVDAVFVIEFMVRFLRKEVEVHKNDFLLSTLSLRNSVFRDMVLLENQLPYFVLEEVSRHVLPKIDPKLSFQEFVFEFFEIKYARDDRDQFKHFVDLLRYARVRSIRGYTSKPIAPESKRRSAELLNVKRLQQVGVDFGRIHGNDRYSVEMEVNDRQLRMAKFWVDDRTETELKNVIALEQHHFLIPPLVSNYAMMLELLITTEEDVRILARKGIIQNHIGNDDVVVNLVKSLCKGVVVESSCFLDITEEIVKHQDLAWSQMKYNFFNSYVKGAATVASVIALLLTLWQTVASTIQIWPRS